MIKKFRLELLVLGILILNIFVSYNIDIGFYNLFNNFNNSFQNIYLKEFFVRITSLGDSTWYFIISLFFFFIGVFLRGKKFFTDYKKILNLIISFGIFLFSSVLITGIITQFLKHIVGRPRPNYTSLEENIGFSFFNLSSEFHSFPSGHASTIFVVALSVSFFLPKLKNFLICLSALVAFSRVVVGAHFFTDIVGGCVVAYVGFKLTKIILKKYNFIKESALKDREVFVVFDSWFGSHKIFYLFFVLFCIMLFITIGPSIDIYLSSLFYFGEKQFLLQSLDIITILFREIIIRGIVIYILILPIVSLWFPLKKLYFDYEFSMKDILFVWTTSLFNSIVIINLFFKGFWGRARPGETIQLGGEENFTPWYIVSDACNTNCSFVSGDAAIGFTIIALYFLTKKNIFFWMSIILGGALGSIRIMEGGHFLSDVVMAASIIYVAYFFQTKYFLKK